MRQATDWHALIPLAAAGLAVGELLPPALSGGAWLMVGAAVLTTAGARWSFVPGARIACVAVTLTACALGMRLGASARAPGCRADRICALALPAQLLFEGIVAGPPLPRGPRLRIDLDVEATEAGNAWRPLRGRVRLSVPSAPRGWRAGDCMRVRARLREARNFRNPGAFDYVGYLRRQGIDAVGGVWNAGAISRCDRVPRGPRAWIARLRNRLGSIIEEAVGRPSGGVLRAVILGDRSGLGDTTRDDFARAGVAHVLAVSGLHVGIVGAAAFKACTLMVRGRVTLLARGVVPRLSALAALPVVGAYVALAGARGPVVRAGIMIAVYLVGLLLGRRGDVERSLAVAALVVGVGWPESVFDPSCTLSFAAVLSITRVLRWYRRRSMHGERLATDPTHAVGGEDSSRSPVGGGTTSATVVRRMDDASFCAGGDGSVATWRGWLRWGWLRCGIQRTVAWGTGSFAVSLAAAVGTAPLAARYFNQLSLIGPFANLLLVPAFVLAVVLGFAGSGLALAVRGLGEPMIAAAAAIIDLSMAVCRAVAAWPAASVRVVTPSALEVALLYGALAGLLGGGSRWGRTLLVVVAVVGAIDAAWWMRARYARPALRVTFLDVGQGDAAVVEFPGARVLVVDGGGLPGSSLDTGETIVARYLWSRKINHVDYVAMTHADTDHAGGLAFVVRQFSPGELWWNGYATDGPAFDRLMRAAGAQGVRRRTLHDDVPAWTVGPVRVEALAPSSDLGDASTNDGSLVLRLVWGRTTVLLAGDIEAAGEASVTERQGEHLGSAVLKVPHHGSRTSSTRAFLEAVRPRVAVMSVGGGNRYGFPHPEVARRYEALGVCLRRTDEDGAVTVEGDPDGYRVEPPCAGRDGGSMP